MLENHIQEKNKFIKKCEKIKENMECKYCKEKGFLEYANRLNKYTFQCLNCGKYQEYKSLLEEHEKKED